MRGTLHELVIPVQDYDLAGTLASGQAFRWRQQDDAWYGVVAEHWVRLRSTSDAIIVETVEPVQNWDWLTDYLQVKLDLNSVLQTFPKDEPLSKAVHACRGLRLLKQEPWECLASFILSSTKQIIQIQQIVGLLCTRYGRSVAVPAGQEAAFSFPSSKRLSELSEADLRDCKMGFRAPYLLETAKMIEQKEVDLASLYTLGVDQARDELMKFPGVGKKIADCVLLFAYGFQSAFPVDVWVMKALRHLYFPKRYPNRKRLETFTKTYFGPNAGYAQQYLFHYMRTKHAL